ncbi:PfkB family carbohydrate kinase [Wukongibacter sp. M2B1]|uniref:PfkB family carbohydrate kinase n=1 Tax=Wukongibacter sp. M2B1 TaxID=3088895 RepID=UPI003D7BC33B
MKIIAIGDNVTDCYLDQKVYYPGGNCVNVAVNCKRNGADKCAYIGIFGNDEKADHIRWALDQEGISYNCSRFMIGISGQPRVNLTSEGDRVFVGGPKNTVQHIVRLRLTKEDLEYISQFDLCHTSCYSSIEMELAEIKKHCSISFDFSENKEETYLNTVCPHIKFAFFSGSSLNLYDIEKLIQTCHSLGTEIVGVTRGSKGALFSKNGEIFKQDVKPTEVVDTMGAGDSFIAGFLTHYTKNKNMKEALDFAAICASKTCSIDGAFGYPHVFNEDSM